MAKAKADAKANKAKSSNKSKDKLKANNAKDAEVTSVDVVLEFSVSRSGLVGLDKVSPKP